MSKEVTVPGHLLAYLFSCGTYGELVHKLDYKLYVELKATAKHLLTHHCDAAPSCTNRWEFLSNASFTEVTEFFAEIRRKEIKERLTVLRKEQAKLEKELLELGGNDDNPSSPRRAFARAVDANG